MTNSIYSNLNSLGEMWEIIEEKFSNITALIDSHSQEKVKLNYGQLCQNITQFASGLQAKGIKPETKIALIADNSPRWLMADQGIMKAGCVNAVRSSQAEKTELLYIIEDSDSKVLVVEDKATLAKLQPELNALPIELIILLTDEPSYDNVVNFSELIALGQANALQKVTQNQETLATLIYTSGTTGKPKGVMLSHGNLLHQIKYLSDVIKPEAGDRALSILPSWHSYERAAEYFLLSRGCTLIYTNIRYFKTDLKEFKPHYLVGVPRLWESIYEGIQKQFRDSNPNQQKIINFSFQVSENYLNAKRISKGLTLDNLNPSFLEKLTSSLVAIATLPLHKLADKLVYHKIREGVGGNVKTWISGGGALAKHIDNFFQIVNIPLIVGYGLTETSPVTNARRLDRNIVGASGQPLAETEIKIIDLESKQPLPQGEKGLVLIRGSQVMQGYYKKPEETAKVIDKDGWFNSGDLGWVTPENDLVITGRAKDTIVLSNGENIEPQGIEDACIRSIYIDQIMLVGQDQKSLGALIVPNLDTLETWIKSQNLNLKIPSGDNLTRQEIENSDLYNSAILDLFKQELAKEVKNRAGYRPDDRIASFHLILEPFSIANGMLTQTLKTKRAVVTEYYQDLIKTLF